MVWVAFIHPNTTKNANFYDLKNRVMNVKWKAMSCVHFRWRRAERGGTWKKNQSSLCWFGSDLVPWSLVSDSSHSAQVLTLPLLARSSFILLKIFFLCASIFYWIFCHFLHLVVCVRWLKPLSARADKVSVGIVYRRWGILCKFYARYSFYIRMDGIDGYI